MSIFSYLTPGEAMTKISSGREWEQIIGLKGISAERIMQFPIRTKAGYLRNPGHRGIEHNYLDKFKEIARMEWANDAEPGMVEVFFSDGSTDLISKYDLLCVERST